MKKLIILTISLGFTLTSVAAFGQHENRFASARYYPVVEFVGINSTLGKWFKQYVDTSVSGSSFKDFLNRLSDSEVLWQRSRRAGLKHNQLYSPIITLLAKDWKSVSEMTDQEMATVRLSMLELDIALSAIDSTLPKTAQEEFRREVLRGAKPLSGVAKLPTGAVEVMAFTLTEHKVSDRLNRQPGFYQKIRRGIPASINPQPFNPPVTTNPALNDQYRPW